MNNTKDDAKRRVRTLRTIGIAPSPSAGSIFLNAVEAESQRHFREPRLCLALDSTSGVRRDLRFKLSEDYEQAPTLVLPT
jgi:hypothetical protein